MAAPLASFPIAHGVYTLAPLIGTVAPTTFMLGRIMRAFLLLITMAFAACFGEEHGRVHAISVILFISPNGVTVMGNSQCVHIVKWNDHDNVHIVKRFDGKDAENIVSAIAGHDLLRWDEYDVDDLKSGGPEIRIELVSDSGFKRIVHHNGKNPSGATLAAYLRTLGGF